MSHRFVSVVDTAKLVRKALKAAFAGVRFSVRSQSYSGGASINVSWLDGPTPRAVDEVIKAYEGGRFDSQIDLAYSAKHWLCPHGVASFDGTYGHSFAQGDFPEGPHCPGGELVRFGADHVFGHRTMSEEFTAEVHAILAARYGRPYDPNVMIDGQWMSNLVWREACQLTR